MQPLPFKFKRTGSDIHSTASGSMPITQKQKQKKLDNKDGGETASPNSKATATNKEKEVGNGKKPRPNLDVHEHEQGGGVSSSSSSNSPIMQNPYGPYLPRHFQAYSPFSSSKELNHLSPLRQFDPPSPSPKRMKHEHDHDHDLVRMRSLPPTTTNSPVRNKFGNEYYYPISTAPAAVSKKDPLPPLLPPPPPAVAAAEEVKKAKKKGNGNGGGDYVIVRFPTCRSIPKLSGKMKEAGRSYDDSMKNEVTLTLWDQKFDELVSISTELIVIVQFYAVLISVFIFMLILSLSLSSSLR